MTALFVAWYNFARPNMALGKGVTPAMAAGLTESQVELEKTCCWKQPNRIFDNLAESAPA